MNINGYIQNKTQMVHQLYISWVSIYIVNTDLDTGKDPGSQCIGTLFSVATGRTDICLMLFCFMLLENHYEKDFDCSVISLLHFRLCIHIAM